MHHRTRRLPWWAAATGRRKVDLHTAEDVAPGQLFEVVGALFEAEPSSHSILLDHVHTGGNINSKP